MHQTKKEKDQITELKKMKEKIKTQESTIHNLNVNNIQKLNKDLEDSQCTIDNKDKEIENLKAQIKNKQTLIKQLMSKEKEKKEDKSGKAKEQEDEIKRLQEALRKYVRDGPMEDNEEKENLLKDIKNKTNEIKKIKEETKSYKDRYEVTMQQLSSEKGK